MREKEEKVLSKKIMKNLLPSLRENNRYVKFQTNEKIDANKFKQKFEKEIISCLGQLELAKSSYKLINFNGNQGIIKVNVPYLNKIKTCLTLINNIDDEKIIMKSVKVSGMLNKVK